MRPLNAVGRISQAHVVGFVFAVSAVLAPIRLGGIDALRPSVILALPCVAYILLTKLPALRQSLRTTSTLLTLGLFAMLLVGFLVENDVLAGGNLRVLTVENLIFIPALYLTANIIAKTPTARNAFAVGLLFSIGIQVLALAIAPPDVSFKGYARSSGFFEDPNIVLLHLLPPFFLAVALRANSRSRILEGAGFYLLTGFGAILSLSRAGLLTMAICSVLVLVFYMMKLASGNPSSRSSHVRSGLVVILLIAVASWSFFDSVAGQLVSFKLRVDERLAETGLAGDRLDLLAALTSLDTFQLLNPIGIGYRSFVGNSGMLPHNTFVDVLVIAGPLAFLVLILLYARTIRSILKRLRWYWRDEWASWSACFLLTALLSQALLLGSLSVLTWKIHWVLLGFINGILFSKRAVEWPSESVVAN